MKKSEHKMILNLQVEEQELERKIKVAIDDYVERAVIKNLDEAIQKIVTKRIDAIVAEKPSWDGGAINGQKLSSYVISHSTPIIEKTINSNIEALIIKRFSQILGLFNTEERKCPDR